MSDQEKAILPAPGEIKISARARAVAEERAGRSLTVTHEELDALRTQSLATPQRDKNALWPFVHGEEPPRCNRCGKYAFRPDYHDDCEVTRGT